MTSTERPRGFGSDWPTGLGRARGTPHSPLALIGVIKGPKNREKEKYVETERKERDNLEINHIHFDNATPEHPQRQEGLSLILTVSPKLRQIHQEQVESSGRHDNNTKLMEMLKIMRQEM